MGYYRQIRALYEAKGYRYLDRKINLFGVKCQHYVTDRFDDFLGLAYWNGSEGTCFKWSGTTRSGKHYTDNPMNPKGTLVMKPGQWEDCWEVGKHNGRYETLIQTAPIMVYRDDNRDDVVDEDAATEEFGCFGANIHHALDWGTTETVGLFGAGCQVFGSVEDWALMMEKVRYDKMLGRSRFTYTLFELADFQLVKDVE